MSDVITCGRCKSACAYAATPGAPIEKMLESMGWRKIGGEWVCLVCTGSLGSRMEANPELGRFIHDALRGEAPQDPNPRGEGSAP